jgi:hypothetical protein
MTLPDMPSGAVVLVPGHGDVFVTEPAVWAVPSSEKTCKSQCPFGTWLVPGTVSEAQRLRDGGSR